LDDQLKDLPREVNWEDEEKRAMKSD
jgi:hypothetical protein